MSRGSSESEPSLEYLRTAALHFAEICGSQAPLYAELSRRVAEEPSLLALAQGGTARQPPMNLLFGAVHYLLLVGSTHPLSEFYPSVGGVRPADGAFPEFVDFCGGHQSEITALVRSKRVQTNEVGRCALLLPGILFAWKQSGRPPLHLVEVGASAGLNLLLDRYRYEYGEGLSLGAPEAPTIRTEVRGDIEFPIPDGVPEVAARVGVDTHPVDATDAESVRWLEALIWPDQVHRIELLRQAVAVAREDPPEIVRGDALELLPAVVSAAPPGSVPCVFHSYVTYQMGSAVRRNFDDLMADLGQERELLHVAMEWLGDDVCPQLHVTTGAGAERHRVHLAESHYHGAWVRWLTPERTPPR